MGTGSDGYIRLLIESDEYERCLGPANATCPCGAQGNEEISLTVVYVLHDLTYIVEQLYCIRKHIPATADVIPDGATITEVAVMCDGIRTFVADGQVTVENLATEMAISFPSAHLPVLLAG